MASASCGLLLEGLALPPVPGHSQFVPPLNCLLGGVAGWLLINTTQHWLDQREAAAAAGAQEPRDSEAGGQNGGWALSSHGHDECSGKSKPTDWATTRRVVLVMLVMTLHSFAEGIGIGVSFAGDDALGAFISLSLAVHNIPEGLAVALVMHPRGISLLDTALWAVFSSLPQPIASVPAYLFVVWFQSTVPAGLGLAGGAMLQVVTKELLPDALRDLGRRRALVTSLTAFVGMSLAQWGIHESTHQAQHGFALT